MRKIGTRLVAVASCSLFAFCPAVIGAEGPRVLPAGKLPADRRLEPPKNLDGYFPFEVPASQEAWAARAGQLRRQLLVALGLWPLPDRTPPNAVVHTPLDKVDYTVEHVYLESWPGHFVTGNLYRPKGRTGKLPAVLCPHGHWANGRFTDAGPEEIRRQIVQGAEKFEDSGRSPLQARCMQLARMGCMVFHYDMVGYADSRQIPQEIAHGFKDRRPHMEGEKWGFFSPQAEARLQHIMGLQTYNSLRALDWICELPDVDATRIGVTGASGGGTQTFILCAIDSRPAVAFPAVMVSTAMQGGCTCENCCYLRVGTGNIEISALTAPRPLGMTGADDWTKEIQAKGLPELTALYDMLGVKGNVMARSLNHFGHNYNYVSRAVMYSWFNQHLQLGFEDPIVEDDYDRLSTEELTVWDESHPAPAGGEDYERSLLAAIDRVSNGQLDALVPANASAYPAWQEIVGGAWRAMLGRELPAAGEVEFEKTLETDRGTYVEFAGLLRTPKLHEVRPAVFLQPKSWNKKVVIWLHPGGKAGLYGSSGLSEGVQELLARGTAVAGLDVLRQGEFLSEGQPLSGAPLVETPRQFAGFTYGYNDPLVVQRAHDVLAMIGFVKHHEQEPDQIHVLASGEAAPWAVLACVGAGQSVNRLAIDSGGFRFAALADYDHPDFMPGAVKYGDLPGALASSTPAELWLAGETEIPSLVRSVHACASPPVPATLNARQEKLRAAVAWLSR